jgi:predicted P-loop ATPase
MDVPARGAAAPHDQEARKRAMIVIGAGGSIDYLEDVTGRRYWPVAASKTVLKLCPIDGCRLWKDLRATRRVNPIVDRLPHREDQEQQTE